MGLRGSGMNLATLLNWPPGQAPWIKQEEAFAKSAGRGLFALFMEQRTGKTIVTLGDAVLGFDEFEEAGGFGVEPGALTRSIPPLPKFNRIGDLPKKPTKPGMIYRPASWATAGIDALLVVAMPSGVPANWAAEAAARLPSRVNAKAFIWKSDKASTVHFSDDFKVLLGHDGLVILAINGEAIASPIARKAIGTFLRTRRALCVADETSLLCSQPGNVRARTLVAISKLPGAVRRRILDGTPSDESPLDLFAQVSFLDPKITGFDLWTPFKRYYAVWGTAEVYVKGVRREFEAVVKDAAGKPVWAHLDELAANLAPHSFRVKRTDCFDVPDKVFAPYRFELSKAQRDVYDPLREEFEAELRDGTVVTVPHALARMIRLDQIGSNFYPPVAIPTICQECSGEGCPVCKDVGAIMGKTAKKIIDPDRNPRIEAFADVLSTNKEPGIAWATCDETIDAIISAAKMAGRIVVRYDGKVPPEQKAINLFLFKSGHADLIVAKESSAGRGLDLSRAAWMCYVENGWSKRKRSQSEDRCEVAGRSRGTGIIDLAAVDTYDGRKIDAHKVKGEVAETFMKWLVAGGKK